MSKVDGKFDWAVIVGVLIGISILSYVLYDKIQYDKSYPIPQVDIDVDKNGDAILNCNVGVNCG